MVFAVGLACSFGAAALLQALGWQLLNVLLLHWLALGPEHLSGWDQPQAPIHRRRLSQPVTMTAFPRTGIPP